MRNSWGEMEFREGILGTKNIQKYFSEMKNGKGRGNSGRNILEGG